MTANEITVVGQSDDAKADIEKEQKQAQQEVQGEIAKLALIAARKIIETGEAHDAEGSK